MGNYASNALSYGHTQREVVKMAMDAGGCGGEYRQAHRHCDGRENAADVQACIKATADLRRCMDGNQCHFKNFIKTMEEGLDQDDQRRSGTYSVPEAERWRWRWWTGMIRS
jgi:hypothetical protein